MDERPLDPARVYLLKHTTRTVTAEVDHGLVLNQIGTVDGHDGAAARCSTATRDNRGTGSFILIDPATNFTAGAGMITESGPRAGRGVGAAERRRAAGAPGARGGVRRRSDRSGAPRARGDTEMSTRSHERIAAPGGPIWSPSRQLVVDSSRDPDAVHHVQLSGGGCRGAAHLLRRSQPDIPVLFLDTLHHFAQTYAYRDEIAERWKLNLDQPAGGGAAVGLWQTSTDACCARHKVEPLFSALEALRRLVHGAAPPAVAVAREPRRSRAVPAAVGQVDHEGQPAGRVDDARTSGSTRRRTTSRCCRCTSSGYTSIGCEPCTSLPLDPSDPRSGRWQGQKLECGIHIQPVKD